MSHFFFHVLFSQEKKIKMKGGYTKDGRPWKLNLQGDFSFLTCEKAIVENKGLQVTFTLLLYHANIHS